MKVEELIARFPEIPPDLHSEPSLARFADVFDALLRIARNPSNCSTSFDAANHYYLKLVGPMSIYGYGLSSREEVLGEIDTLLARQRADPAGFAATLLPPETADGETRGPGCE